MGLFVPSTSSFTSEEQKNNANGILDLHITITGPGPVTIEQKQKDDVWRSFPETTFSGPQAVILSISKDPWRVVVSGGPTIVEIES